MYVEKDMCLSLVLYCYVNTITKSSLGKKSLFDSWVTDHY